VVWAVGPSGSRVCQSFPQEAVEAHLGALFPTLEYLKISGAHWIFLSSFHLYRGNELPFDESMELIPDGDLYRALKLQGEYLFQKALNTTILRLPHVYGLGLGYAVDPEGVVARCIQACLSKWGHLELTEQGNIKWQFLHLYDLVRVVEAALVKSVYGVFNVGNPQPAKLVDVLNLTARVADTPVPVAFGKLHETGRSMFMDVSRGRSALGWGQAILMEQGIREMVTNYDRWKS
jgi:nucleoside-diphosphate-sugar epimerase